MSKYRLTRDTEKYLRRSISVWYGEVQKELDKWYDSQKILIDQEYQTKIIKAKNKNAEQQAQIVYESQKQDLNGKYYAISYNIEKECEELRDFSEYKILNRDYDPKAYTVDWKNRKVLSTKAQDFSLSFKPHKLDLDDILEVEFKEFCVKTLASDSVEKVELEDPLAF